MKLLVGLGNPGPRYGSTRHNVGFRVMERFARRAGIQLAEERFDARLGRGRIGQVDLWVLLPQTYMNHSGASVAAALATHPEVDVGRDLLVAYDDADLPLGRIRLRARGGAGGHRGLADVLDHLQREDVPRLRIGIGRPHEAIDTVSFVLGAFAAEEEKPLGIALDRACDAIDCFVAWGITPAMDGFNAAPG